VEREAEVELFPVRRRVRVRGIEVYNQSVPQATAGQRTALNLAGIEAGEVSRGMVLAAPGLFENSDRLDCALTLLNSVRALKNRSRVHFHSGTAETLAEVVLLQVRELKPGDRTYAQLRLTEPGLFLPGDRFIIRQFSPVTTIGGGIVLDNRPARHRTGDPAAQALLEQLEHRPNSRVELLVRESGEATVAGLAARTGWSPAEIARRAQAAVKENRLLALGQQGSLLVDAEHFDKLASRILTTLEAFHLRNPLVPGLGKEDLRGRLAPNPNHHADSSRLPSPGLFNATLQALASNHKLRTEGEVVRLAGREVQLSAEETAAKERISRAFEQAGLTVPPAADVLAQLPVDRARAQKILQILVRAGTLVKVSEGLLFHRSALDRLHALLAQRKTKSSRMDVAAFKEMTGVTRKYAIPLLEYLDRERFTRREGDVRVIL
jgi:selenocysteine-specific elongation factor